MTVARLPRERESAPLGDPVVLEDHEVVTVAPAREVAVDDRRLDQTLGLHVVEPVTQPWVALGVEELLQRRSALTSRAA